jgi:hypothetical protein
MEIDSKDFIEYFIGLDIQQKRDLLEKIEAVLGKTYTSLIEDAILYKNKKN